MSDQFSIVFIGVVALWFAVVLLVRVGYSAKLAQFASRASTPGLSPPSKPAACSAACARRAAAGH